jgi:hypothetical protein
MTDPLVVCAGSRAGVLRGMWRALPLAIIIVPTSCTGASPSSGPATPVGVDQPATATLSGGTGSATLVVRQRYRGPGYYIEGAIGFVEVSTPGTAAVTRWERQIQGRGRRRFSLPPGTYSLTSWQRPCDGNCQDGLDPPVDGCEASITIREGEIVNAIVTVTPDSGCTIAFP